uniref:MYND-type domain-containing protein n=1 Tax=Lygus hesperus TaxID=30085 RepID=A0A146L2M2_LYGHE
MTSERATEFKVWYRPQFISNVCHICKTAPGNESLTCPGCGLVSYCSQRHLEEDEDDHEDICDALKGVVELLGTKRAHDKAYLLGPDQWREFRLGVANLCSKQLGRPLMPWETEVCLYPPHCATCHKFCTATERCLECHSISWCSSQHKPKQHSEHCRQLTLMRQILQRKVHVIKAPQLNGVPADMNSLFSEGGDVVTFSLLTEIATSPLTILQHLTNSESASVHIIGPEPHFEANNLSKWEIFLFNLLPSVLSLTLNFVGPEIGPLPPRKINKNGRTLNFTFHQVLYHDFISKGCVSIPSLICALNPGLYRSQGFDGQDSWQDTIDAMFKHTDVPVLVTAYTKKRNWYGPRTNQKPSAQSKNDRRTKSQPILQLETTNELCIGRLQSRHFQKCILYCPHRLIGIGITCIKNCYLWHDD